ncbi:universal stress protein [Psychroserpens sp. XS_ASV72]|uniref:universal stress protein n=1 Tax=Psychroserpens sp. XS_ASV72 TaxID=3241293 RepID=UPI00351106F5
MKRILLLTDFSDSAMNAVHYTLQFFETQECTFYLMNVHKAGTFISDDLVMASNQSIYDSLTKKPKENLELIVSEITNRYQNKKHHFETIIDFDVFTDAVNQAIKVNDIDLVVIGSNGATGAKEIIFGSNTLNVIRNVLCKTLVVPNGYTYKAISNFLLPLQVDDDFHENQLKTVHDFVENYDLNFHILRVCNSAEAEKHTKFDLTHLENYNCTYSVEKHKSFYDAVIHYIEANTIDMTGLIVHDKGFIKRLLTESPAVELSKVIILPLMIFHSLNN